MVFSPSPNLLHTTHHIDERAQGGQPRLVLYTRGLARSVVGDVVLDIVDDLPGVSVSVVVVLVLLRLDLRPVLAAAPRVHQLVVEVVVVVLVEIGVRHGGS